MHWSKDVAAGDWIRERIDDPWAGTIHDIVPRGFAAYARIFHPAWKSRPIGDSWPPLPYERHRAEWEAFNKRSPEIETVEAKWADAASAFNTTLHPLAQWGALVRERGAEWDPNVWQQVNAPDGWQFDAPIEGELDAAVLTAVVRHLCPQGAGYAALWNGWGGLLGFMGEAPSRMILNFGEEASSAEEHRHNKVLGGILKDRFNNPFRKLSWQPGILNEEISTGPQLELPGREYVLFEGDLGIFARADWVEKVLWYDREGASLGFPPRAQSPAYLWPEDHSWVLSTEVDFDSTIVGGSAELIAAICADPAIEALPLEAGSSLQWDADTINR